TTGTQSINTINPEATAKNTAKSDIDAAANAKKAEIDARPDLTVEEKAAAKAQVDAEVKKAKDAIDAATSNDAVESAKTTGTQSINTINPEATAKNTAKS
ncbi:DUF1542 domain-containing protein, partial [Streptococcus sp. 19428wC2_LYSM12]